MDTPELLSEALGALGFRGTEPSLILTPEVFLKRPNTQLLDAILHFQYVAYKGAKGKQVDSWLDFLSSMLQHASERCVKPAACRR